MTTTQTQGATLTPDVGLTIEELRQAVSLGEIYTGFVRRVIAHDGRRWGVYGWTRPLAGQGEEFTLLRLVVECDWNTVHAQPHGGMIFETSTERKRRLHKVKSEHPGGLIVGGPDGTRYVIDETVRLVVAVEHAGRRVG